jgi:hypothetical protein
VGRVLGRRPRRGARHWGGRTGGAPPAQRLARGGSAACAACRPERASSAAVRGARCAGPPRAPSARAGRPRASHAHLLRRHRRAHIEAHGAGGAHRRLACRPGGRGGRGMAPVTPFCRQIGPSRGPHGRPPAPAHSPHPMAHPAGAAPTTHRWATLRCMLSAMLDVGWAGPVGGAGTAFDAAERCRGGAGAAGGGPARPGTRAGSLSTSRTSRNARARPARSVAFQHYIQRIPPRARPRSRADETPAPPAPRAPGRAARGRGGEAVGQGSHTARRGAPGALAAAPRERRRPRRRQRRRRAARGRRAAPSGGGRAPPRPAPPLAGRP